MDFLPDQLFDGRKIRVLTIADNFTRVSPALDVRLSYRGAVATLEQIAATSPTDNAFAESFNDKFGAECLNATGSSAWTRCKAPSVKLGGLQ